MRPLLAVKPISRRERINLACVEYSWKFGPCVRLELGQKQPFENNESPTKYPNIKWNNDNLGANVTNKALDEANKANKTWLEDHGFATTTSKRNDVELVAAATVTMISTANLEKFLHIKERDPDNFELVSAFWCAEHRKQMDDYVLSKKDIYLHDHDHQYYYWR